MNMMNWEVFNEVNPFSKIRNSLLKTLETELENSFGPDLKALTESGSVSTAKNSQRNGRNISIKYTSEPNITTIQMTSTPLQSTEVSSNTTTQTTYPEETGTGVSKELASTSAQQSTSPIPQVKNPIARRSWLSELMDRRTST